MSRDWVFDLYFDYRRVKGPVKIQYFVNVAGIVDIVDIADIVGIVDIAETVGNCDYTKQDYVECAVGRAMACINH